MRDPKEGFEVVAELVLKRDGLWGLDEEKEL